MLPLSHQINNTPAAVVKKEKIKEEKKQTCLARNIEIISLDSPLQTSYSFSRDGLPSLSSDSSGLAPLSLSQHQPYVSPPNQVAPPNFWPNGSQPPQFYEFQQFAFLPPPTQSFVPQPPSTQSFVPQPPPTQSFVPQPSSHPCSTPFVHGLCKLRRQSHRVPA